MIWEQVRKKKKRRDIVIMIEYHGDRLSLTESYAHVLMSSILMDVTNS